MKVLLAATDSSYVTGAAKSLIDLYESYTAANNQVVISLPRHGDIEEQLNIRGIPYVILRERGGCWVSHKRRDVLYPIKRVVNFFSVLKAARYIKREKFDLVHINAITAYVPALAAIMKKVPVTWHIREFLEEDLENHFLDRKWSLKMINRADRVIANSKAVADKWQQFVERRIEVIYNKIDEEKYSIALNEKTCDPDMARIIIYGRIMPKKGQLFCVKGYELARREFSCASELIIAGSIEDKDYFESVQEYIRKCGMEDCVKYVGEIKDVKELLRSVDISCVCSEMEAFGRVTLESILASCEVLGADTGGTVEIVQDRKCGVLYHAGDLGDFAAKLTRMVNELGKKLDN